MSQKSYFIGTSGFHYKSWRETFYPANLAEKDWLPFYADRFNSVEINNSFYRLPEKKTLAEWNDQTPSGFSFTLKGSRYTTHMKKLKMDDDLRDSVNTFYNAAKVLKSKLGCVLWQLPGNLHRNDDKLEAFCRLLPGTVPNCIEFRHESWFDDNVMDILDKSGTGFCIVSSPDKSLTKITDTGRLAYFRFHGENKNGHWYDYNYSDKELGQWSKNMKTSRQDIIFAYFNNDMHGYAPQNAASLLNLME
ncbi:MAG TPA: DUF72 domain-containing protein [Bacteroidales bacterium]|nr:DUF72 domain-containing protein [Bacteroidales bacterium]